MALTRTEIITYTRSIVDEVNESPILLDSEIGNFVNRRYHEMEDVIKNVNENYFATTGTIATVVDQELYTLPQDSNSFNEVDRIIRIEVAYDGSNFDIAEPTTISSKRTTESNTSGAYSEAYPQFYLLDHQVGLLPVPSAVGSMKIWYTKILPDLVNGTDVSEMPLKYDRILAVGAAVDVLRKDFYYPESDRYEDDYYKSLEKVRNGVTPRQLTRNKQVQRARRVGTYAPEYYIRRGSLN